MELIDRYVAEVGRQLPDKQRADIEKEIRSTLEDMLEDRSQKTGRPADEALQAEILKEYGSPEKVASAYLPPRYLIGPRLYPMFTLVLRIVLAVIVGVGLFQFGLTMVQARPGAEGWLPLIGTTLLGLLSSAIAAFGNVVLVFVILERAVVQVKMPAEAWNPRDLPPVSEPERFKQSEIVMEVVFTLGAVLLLNFYPQLIRIGFFNGQVWTFVPMLTAAFFRYLPWINGVCVLQLVQNLVLLRQGRWQPATRWFSVVVDGLSVGITYAMLTGPAIVQLSAETLQSATPMDARAAGVLATMTTGGVSLALAIALIVECVEIVRTLYTLLIKPRRTAVPAA